MVPPFSEGFLFDRLNYSEVLKSKTKIYQTWKWSLILLMVQKSGENPPGMYKTPADNGIKYQPELVIAGFLVAINSRELWLASTHVPHPWYPTFLPVTGGMTKKGNKSAVLIKGNGGGGSEEVLKSLFPMRWKSRFFFFEKLRRSFFLTGGQSLQVGNSHHDHHGVKNPEALMISPKETPTYLEGYSEPSLGGAKLWTNVQWISIFHTIWGATETLVGGSARVLLDSKGCQPALDRMARVDIVTTWKSLDCQWLIIPQLAVYTTYIPLIVLANWVIICYRSHLLREPGNSIEIVSSRRVTRHSGKIWVFLRRKTLAVCSLKFFPNYARFFPINNQYMVVQTWATPPKNISSFSIWTR